MGFSFATLYRAPEINPVNRKARSVPMLNPIDPYGRVFFFSWFGFMVAFWAWYSTSKPAPPLKLVPHSRPRRSSQVLNHVLDLLRRLTLP